ncbi:hypothetical protein GV828_07655 [Flavobacterium sp. NST-5]|uniref:Uncharacterized protein n=1 Tax=Flavobacterium ichthyis TaxID=2698827 RepID=A0ABW9Z869_9FLAO|nr:hypothetical protein [Flavobacterium ichthyis]NBL65072.1 hypothetical protein [Flavobacterium ichthyis]
MKALLIIFSVLFFGNSQCFGIDNDELDPNKVMQDMFTAIHTCNTDYQTLISKKELEIRQINKALERFQSIDVKLTLILEKDKLRESIQKLKTDNASDISRIRYLKGLQIIRILYEKVLSLDHHFASVRTFSEINKIANPNQYPEFTKVKEMLQNKRDKKLGFDLTSILGTNTLVSVVNTFSNMLVSGLTKEEKEAELKNIECIIDFTLRMQGDLNTIYFETSFLQKSNDKVKADIEILFKDYTKPINYLVSLEECRSNDDWETVRKNMSDYLNKLAQSTGSEQTKMYINIEFPIDRLMQFITQYNNFIDQGGKFYEKFKIILNSYENEQQCQSKLPIEYQKLKNDIDVAINKFNVAYRPVEVNGSKMKEILYGINEYE